MHTAKRTILLLEDDPMQALVFQGAATDVNDCVVVVNNVDDALRIVSTAPLAACVVDLGVYGKAGRFGTDAGLRFIVEARRRVPAGMPIVVYSATSRGDLVHPCFEAGCDEFLKKEDGYRNVVRRTKELVREARVAPRAQLSRRAAVLAGLRTRQAA